MYVWINTSKTDTKSKVPYWKTKAYTAEEVKTSISLSSYTSAVMGLVPKKTHINAFTETQPEYCLN